MKSFLAVVLLFGFLTAAARAQQDADEKYLAIYGLIQQADAFSAGGQPQSALEAYQQAQAGLANLHGGYPDWNPRIVIFRQKYLAAKIEDLKAALPRNAAAPGAARTAPGVAVAGTPANNGSSAPADWADQLAALRRQLQNYEADNATLAAKLKEALAVQPAAMDPRELAAARMQITDLLKQNELLKATAEQAQKSRANDAKVQQLETITKQLEAANAQLAAQQKRAEKLAAENAATLAKYLASDKALGALREEDGVIRQQLAAANGALPKVQADLAGAKTQIESLRAEVKTSTAEAERLQKELKAAAKSGDSLPKLSAELTAAQIQINTLRQDLTAKSDEAATLAKQVKAFDKAERPVKKLKDQLAAAQAATKAAVADKEALEQRVRDLQAAQTGLAAVPVTGDTTARINDLTRERDELLAQLGEANRKILSRKSSKEDTAARIAQLTSDLASARSQLNALSIATVPYTAEELALFVSPVTATHTASVKQLPSGSAELAASAQKHFAAKEYDLASADYQKILARDTNNTVVLANLAAIEIEQGNYDGAASHLRAALAQSPDDAYSLTQLGNVQLHQKDFDGALASLSRSVRIDGSNPEAYNYLGVTFSSKGLRLAAENALRKAIQLSPGYAPAHLNLANVYLNQQPPSPQLARWHYQKAIAAGLPASPGIEKQLADLGAPVGQ